MTPTSLRVSLSSLLLAAPLSTQESDLAVRLDTLAERIEAQRIELHIPGLALAVVKDDEIVLARGFGLANLEKETPVCQTGRW
jgi:CubicO group peptidase (beta-lactamase class C family)